MVINATLFATHPYLDGTKRKIQGVTVALKLFTFNFITLGIFSENLEHLVPQTIRCSGRSPVKQQKQQMCPTFFKNHSFFKKLGQNVNSNDGNMLKFYFLNFLQNVMITQFLQKKFNFGSYQLRPKIPDWETQLTPPNILISNLPLYISTIK